MANTVAAGHYPDISPPGSASTRDRDLPAARAHQLLTMAVMLVPGALVVAMGFNDGGYFPGAPAVGAVLLVQLLVIAIVKSPRPFDGLSPASLTAIGALGMYAVLTLASALWSESTGRALLEFDRALFYLLLLVLLASVRAKAAELRRLVRGLAIGISIVCVSGLLTRVLPDVWHTSPALSGGRLSYPVTYWNALGLLASLGIVLTFHLSCSTEERPWSRAIAAGAVPLLALTLFFTFSRGAIAALVVGLAVYILCARPRALLGGVLAALPCTALLVALAYRSNLLDGVDPTTAKAVTQGHLLALVSLLGVGGCVAVRLVLARHVDSRSGSRRRRIRVSPARRYGAVAALLVVTVAAGLALKVPGSVAHDWQQFASGSATTGGTVDFRERLADPASSGRNEYWRVAVQAFSSAPLYGHGAGTYQTLWEHGRHRFAHVVDAHSLYLQAMAELGIPGLASLLVLVGAVLVGLATRAREGSSLRATYGALLAFAAVWALHAGVDWDWEMPVVTVGFVALAGAALGSRTPSKPGWRPRRGARLALAALCLSCVAAPLLVIGSQSRLDVAESAFYETGDCPRASSAARSSIGWLNVRPEPYEILGFCELQRVHPRLAVSEMQRAERADPGDWETHYTLAIAQAAAGIDPRPAAWAALQMNLLEPLALEEVAQFETPNARAWVERAPAVGAEALDSYELDIAP